MFDFLSEWSFWFPFVMAVLAVLSALSANRSARTAEKLLGIQQRKQDWFEHEKRRKEIIAVNGVTFKCMAIDDILGQEIEKFETNGASSEDLKSFFQLYSKNRFNENDKHTIFFADGENFGKHLALIDSLEAHFISINIVVGIHHTQQATAVTNPKKLREYLKELQMVLEKYGDRKALKVETGTF